MEILETLKQLEHELHSIEAPILGNFNEGLREDEICSLFNRVNLHPTRELIELYMWRNGLKYQDIPSGKLSFGVNGVYFPLDDSINIYERSLKEDYSFFFPIFSDDYFLINLKNKSEFFGKIFIYSPPLLINEPTSYFDTLGSMIQTFIRCFKEKVFWYSKEGFFESDNSLFFEIARKVNPNSNYWDND